MGNGISRREFLSKLSAISASLAVMHSTGAMGDMLRCSSSQPLTPIDLPDGKGQRVIILGAGVAGLQAAVNLSRANYQCVVLELSHRIGGRLFTARNGSRIVQKGPDNSISEQICRFDDDIHVELGGGRIPFHHRRVINLWNELGIDYELYAIESMMAKYQSDAVNDGQPLRIRDLLYSTWGYIAELAADVSQTSTLMNSLSGEQRKQFSELLKVFGGLGGKDCNDGDFCGTNRFGCATTPGIHGSFEPSISSDNCMASPAPLSFADLINTEYWKKAGAVGGHTPVLQPSHLSYQSGMLQPTDGMDALPTALSKQFDGQLLLNTAVESVKLKNDGVEIRYRNAQTGKTGTLQGAYCLSSVPAVLLNRIENNFPADAKAALKQAHTRPAVRFAYQANQRFWQNDENQIYGGMSFLDNPLAEIWYPSSGLGKQKGGLMGGFYLRDEATRVGNLSLSNRLKEAKMLGAKIHPQLLDEKIVPSDLALSLAWQQVPGEEGMVTLYRDQQSYERVLAPFGERFHMIGCQASPQRGWVEGALMSVEHVLKQMSRKRPTTLAELKKDPEAEYMFS